MIPSQTRVSIYQLYTSQIFPGIYRLFLNFDSWLLLADVWYICFPFINGSVASSGSFPTVRLVQHRFCNIRWSWLTRDFENNIQILPLRSSTEYIGRYLPFFSPDYLHIYGKTGVCKLECFTKNIPTDLIIMESIYGKFQRWQTTVFVYNY